MRAARWGWVGIVGLSACTVTPPPDLGGDDKAGDTDTLADTPDPSETDAPPDTDSPPATVDTGTPADRDGDGVPDRDDPCPDVANTAAADLDSDGTGDDCDDDIDGDGVPNADDPWPLLVDWPGVATSETIYAHTSSRLFRFNVITQQIDPVGDFTFDRNPGEVTDIAIDRWGVMSAVTFRDAFVCNPRSAACRWLGTLPPGDNNGLTFVPPGVLDPVDDVLIGTSGGNWYQLTLAGQRYQSNALGQYDNQGSTSSGDAFSLEGVGTFASVDFRGNASYDTLVAIDPATGNIQRSIVRFTGGPGDFSQVWGLAGWTDGYVYAFDGSGAVLQVDLASASYRVLVQTPHAWWGAGVRTVVPPP
jgi:hypothetical protein